MVSTSLFKNAVGKFPTGVCVVTTSDTQNQLYGLTVNSFSSVSLAPPLIAFCLKKDSHSLPAFKIKSFCAMHILSGNQAHLAKHFASKDIDRFAKINYQLDSNYDNLPCIAGVASTLKCIIIQRIDAGDHYMFLNQVLECDVDHTQNSLIYYHKNFHSI